MARLQEDLSFKNLFRGKLFPLFLLFPIRLSADLLPLLDLVQIFLYMHFLHFFFEGRPILQSHLCIQSNFTAFARPLLLLQRLSLLLGLCPLQRFSLLPGLLLSLLLLLAERLVDNVHSGRRVVEQR